MVMESPIMNVVGVKSGKGMKQVGYQGEPET